MRPRVGLRGCAAKHRAALRCGARRRSLGRLHSGGRLPGLRSVPPGQYGISIRLSRAALGAAPGTGFRSVHGGRRAGGQPLVRRIRGICGHRRPDERPAGHAPAHVGAVRGGIRPAGERPARLLYPRPAGLRSLVVALRRQPRLGRGLGGRELALPRRMRAGAGAGLRLVHRCCFPGHAGSHEGLGPGAGGRRGLRGAVRRVRRQPDRRLRKNRPSDGACSGERRTPAGSDRPL